MRSNKINKTENKITANRIGIFQLVKMGSRVNVFENLNKF